MRILCRSEGTPARVGTLTTCTRSDRVCLVGLFYEKGGRIRTRPTSSVVVGSPLSRDSTFLGPRKLATPFQLVVVGVTSPSSGTT